MDYKIKKNGVFIMGYILRKNTTAIAAFLRLIQITCLTILLLILYGTFKVHIKRGSSIFLTKIICGNC